MPRTRAALPGPLAQAARRFERWRAERTTQRIPEELWTLATALGARHGVSPTARALRLHAHTLKKRVVATSLPELEPPARPAAFVEIQTPPATTASPEGCRVEYEKASGEKMRVYLRGACGENLARLAQVFLEHRP